MGSCTVTRSIHLSVDYADPAATRAAITEALDAGFSHVVLGLPSPYRHHVAGWVAAELIAPSLAGSS